MESRVISRLALLILLVAGCSTVLLAQRPEEKKPSTFGLSVMAGANFSQIDGDNFKGYNNVGLYAGLRGITRVTSAFEIHIELLYSQKGSKFESQFGSTTGERDRHIKLDYAEIPIMVAYRVTPEYARTQFWLEAGMSIARLLNSDVQDSENPSEKEFIYSEIEDEFGKTDINVIVGLQFNPTPWLGFGLRGSWGVKKFYEDESGVPPPNNQEYVEFLRNYSLSLFAMYHF